MTNNSGEFKNSVAMPIEVIPTGGSAAFGQNGEVVSRTILIRDANNKLFTFYMEAQRDQEDPAVAAAEASEPEPLEPIFSVPCDTLNDSVTKLVLDSVSPDLLDLYLVPQNEW